MNNFNNHILLIEYDKISSYLSSKFLKSTFPNRELVQKSTAESALEYLTKNNPSLVIASYRMPDMTGYEFVKECTNKGLCCGSIHILTDGVVREKQELKKMGVQVISKPLTPDKIAAILQKQNQEDRETI